LLTATAKMGYKLRLMPWGMKRPKLNKSHLDQQKGVRWTMDFKFPCAGVTFLKHRVADTCTWGKVFHQILDSLDYSRKTKVQPYTRKGGKIALFLQNGESPANKKTYFRLELTEKVRDSLKAKPIVEYPTIHVAVSDAEIAQYPIQEPSKSSDEAESDEKATADDDAAEKRQERYTVKHEGRASNNANASSSADPYAMFNL